MRVQHHRKGDGVKRCGGGGGVRRRIVLPRLAERILLAFAGMCFMIILMMSVMLHTSATTTTTNDPSSMDQHNGIMIPHSSISGIGSSSTNVTRRSSSSSKILFPKNKKAITTIIAYAVSISSCGAKSLVDGAVVLEYTIRTAAAKSNVYGYQMYAIVHPEAESCGRELEELGYKIIVRDIPVPVQDIQGEYLRTHIQGNGCCGEKELIKLEAFTLVEHPIVVHLDIDVMVLQPMDKLFDFMLHKNSSRSLTDVGIMWPDQPIPQYIEAMFTKDYNTVAPKRRYKPVQGGLLVFRPSMETYRDFQELLRIGDFRNGTGWGGVTKPSYGAMTIQGILPYYYDYIKNNTKSVELNRCIYNSMADNPRDKDSNGEVVKGKCRTGTNKCEDCRVRPIEDVVNFHFTVCQKPWWCLQLNHDNLNQRMCRKMTHIWHNLRFDMEKSWGRTGVGNGTFDKDHFYGHCRDRGQKGYIQIERPFTVRG